MRLIPPPFIRFYMWYANIISPPNAYGIRFPLLFPPWLLLLMAFFWLGLTAFFTFGVLFAYLSVRPDLQEVAKFLLIPTLALYLGCAQLSYIFYQLLLSARIMAGRMSRR